MPITQEYFQDTSMHMVFRVVTHSGENWTHGKEDTADTVAPGTWQVASSTPIW